MTPKKPTTATKSTTPKKRAPRKSRAKKPPVAATPVRAREDDGTFVGDDPSTPDVNEAYVAPLLRGAPFVGGPGPVQSSMDPEYTLVGADPTPGTITQRGLAALLNVGLEDIVIVEAYNGIGFQTDQGLIGVCMRDAGIEVCIDGELKWSSTSGAFGPRPMFPVTVRDYAAEKDLYTLDIDAWSGGSDPKDLGDGFSAQLTMSKTFPGEDLSCTEVYVRLVPRAGDAPAEHIEGGESIPPSLRYLWADGKTPSEKDVCDAWKKRTFEALRTMDDKHLLGLLVERCAEHPVSHENTKMGLRLRQLQALNEARARTEAVLTQRPLGD